MADYDEVQHHTRNGLMAIIYECYRLFDQVPTDEQAERVYRVIEQCRRIFKALDDE
jgi:hypothetical protein